MTLFLRALLLACAVWFALTETAGAQWSLDTEVGLFHTDDVALFSASRRLALMEDPTQPVVDVTGQGSDMVAEPQAELKRTVASSFGRTEFSVKAQGFIFASRSLYNHATFRFEIEQDLTHSLMLRVNYYYAPDLFLARNVQRSTGAKADERVSSHIYSAHLEGHPTQDLALRLLTRYGSRDYNAAFQNRDTTLWTVGPHAEWAATRWLDVTAGYHYERGLADGRNQPQAKDDVSYINHYVAFGLMFKPIEQHAIFLGGDYEHNIFTSTIVGDERQGQKEDVYQWELEYRRTLSEKAVFTAGFQRSVRSSNLPARSTSDNNTWLGLEYKF